MALSRLATSAGQSLTTWPSTQETMSSLVSPCGALTRAPAAGEADPYPLRVSATGVSRHPQSAAARARTSWGRPSLSFGIRVPRDQLAVGGGQKRRVLPASVKRNEKVLA